MHKTYRYVLILLLIFVVIVKGCRSGKTINPSTLVAKKAEETPAGETPAGETPAGETPAGETPAEETPAGETPAEKKAREIKAKKDEITSKEKEIETLKKGILDGLNKDEPHFSASSIAKRGIRSIKKATNNNKFDKAYEQVTETLKKVKNEKSVNNATTRNKKKKRVEAFNKAKKDLEKIKELQKEIKELQKELSTLRDS